MTVGIDPVAFWLGGIAIRWYGLIAVVGLLWLGRLGLRRSAAFRRSEVPS